MKKIRILGIMLIILGAALMSLGFIPYNETTVSVNDILEMSIFIGFFLILAGIVVLLILFFGRRKGSPEKSMMKGSLTFLSAYFLFVLLISIPLYIFGLRRYNELDNAKRNWALTPATIISATQAGDYKAGNNIDIKFTLDYVINGKKYESTAKSLVSPVDMPQMQPGNIISVWYNPKDPNKIVIDRDYDGGSIHSVK